MPAIDIDTAAELLRDAFEPSGIAKSEMFMQTRGGIVRHSHQCYQRFETARPHPLDKRCIKSGADTLFEEARPYADPYLGSQVKRRVSKEWLCVGKSCEVLILLCRKERHPFCSRKDDAALDLI